MMGDSEWDLAGAFAKDTLEMLNGRDESFKIAVFARLGSEMLRDFGRSLDLTSVTKLYSVCSQLREAAKEVQELIVRNMN